MNKAIDSFNMVGGKTYSVILDCVDVCICVIDPETHKILYLNSAMKEAFGVEVHNGCSCSDVMLGTTSTLCEQCPLKTLDKNDPDSTAEWEATNVKTGRTYLHIGRIIQWFDGRDVYFEQSFDVTEDRQIRHNESHDELTGVLSRRAGKEKLTTMVETSEPFAVCVRRKRLKENERY